MQNYTNIIIDKLPFFDVSLVAKRYNSPALGEVGAVCIEYFKYFEMLLIISRAYELSNLERFVPTTVDMFPL